MAIRNEPSLFSSIDCSKELAEIEEFIDKKLSDPDFIKLSMKGSLEEPYWLVVFLLETGTIPYRTQSCGIWWRNTLRQAGSGCR